MARVVQFRVEGRAQPQPRLRPSMRRDGRIAVMMPRTAQGWRLRVEMAARLACPLQLRGAVAVSMEFVFSRPSTHMTKAGKLRRSAPYYMTSKPDLDNLAKSTADALNGSLIGDDSCIVAWSQTKRYVRPEEQEHAIIRVEEL